VEQGSTHRLPKTERVPPFTAGVNRAVARHNRSSQAVWGILVDTLLAFGGPFPRQPSLLLQLFQSVVLFLVVELDSYLYHTIHTQTTNLCVLRYNNLVMKRTNTFEVVPQSDEDGELLRRLLDASAALWNEINYERRQNYADPDADVWERSANTEVATVASLVRRQFNRSNARTAKRGGRFRTPKEGRSQRQARLLGQRTRGPRPSDVHPQHVVLRRGASSPGSKFWSAKT